MRSPAKSYDWRLKVDAVNGVLPKELKPLVRDCLVSRWRKEKFYKVVGFNYYNNQETDLRELHKNIRWLEEKVKKKEAENNVLKTVVDSMSKHPDYPSMLHEHAEALVKVVGESSKVLKVMKTVDLLGVDSTSFFSWRRELIGGCKWTKADSCKKRNPTVLTKEEEAKMVALLNDPQYAHYPMTSLKWKAHHEGLVHATLLTWLRYKKKHGIKRKKITKGRKRRKKYLSLKSTYPNQYLHADITYFIDHANAKTYYIYIVKDNFSKYIKSWEVSTAISSTTRLETFKEALQDVDLKTAPLTSFITDQGTENRAKVVKKFFKETPNVQILYARKDIPYSNSMVERYNNDLKYMYLFHEEICSIEKLRQCVELAVYEHNFVKRLGCLNGQTPNEVYNKIPVKNDYIKKKWEEAEKLRRERNREISCCVKNLKLVDSQMRGKIKTER